MAFSFSNWFKKPAAIEGGTATTAPEAPPAAAAPRLPATPPASPNAPTSTRPLKTVVPNSVRPVNLREGMARPGGANPLTAPSPASLRPGPSAVPTSTRNISFPAMVPVSPSATVPAPAPAAAPAAPSFQVAPDAKVTIPLGEFFDRLPANLLRPGAAVDREREVVFQASDLYSDLARGRASVPLSAVQTSCPDLFGRSVSPTEDVEVALPLQRVIEQLANTFQARPDQVPEEDVAEIETPFLQVALEDSVRLPRPPAPPTPLPRPVAAAIPAPAPARNPSSKTGNISGTEAATIRALTPRQTPSAPHAPAHAADAPVPHPLTPPSRESAPPLNAAAKRPPSTVRASVAGGKIRLSGPAISSRSIAPAAANSASAPLAPSAPSVVHKPVSTPANTAAATTVVPAQKKTARIQIPAIALRSPGSSGPAPAGPSRFVAAPAGSPSRAVPFPEPLVSFRATPGEGAGSPAAPAPAPVPPSTSLGAPLPPTPRPLPGPRPAGGPAPGFPKAPPPMLPFAPVSFTPPPSVAPAAASAPAPVAAADNDAKISLALAPILRTLPDSLFADGLDGYAAADQVLDNAKVELPLGLITTQLAQGRVAVTRAMFVAAMPASCRHLMPEEGEPTEVLIPLQEVFQNLPTGALSRRQDQVVETIGPEIPTPFSQKAQEDAQRLAPPPEPEPEPEPEPAPVAAVITEPELELEPAPPPVVDLEPAVAPEAPASTAPSPEEDEEPAEEPALASADAEPAAPTAEVPAVTGVEETVALETNPEPVGVVVEEPADDVAAGETPTEVLGTVEETPVHENETAPASETVNEPAAEAEPLPEAVAPVMEESTEPEVSNEPVAPEPLPLSVRDLAPVAPAEALPNDALPVPMLPASNGQHHPPEPAAVVTPGPVPVASLEEIQDALRAIFMVEDDLDAKKVVRLASGLPGLKACAVMFGDGLKLAGDLGEGLSSDEGFCAMTPPFFRRVRTYASELGLGEIQCVTLQTERALLSLFMAGDICLSVQHAGFRPFLPGVREKLLAATAELARMYATPVSAKR